jgi:subtilisin-like proprotein convertase family protein
MGDMMKFLLTGAMAVGLAGTAMLTTATAASALSFSYSNNVPASIPDNEAAGISSDIVITDTANVTDLNVTINGLKHTWVAHLIAQITHVETNTTVDLFNRIGKVGSATGNGSDFDGNYTFDSQSTNDIWAAAAVGNNANIPVGTYFPSTSKATGANTTAVPSSLALFNGQGLNGTWRLTISDRARTLTGSFAGWTLSGQNNASTTAVPVPPQILGTALLAGLTAAKKARGRKAAAVA